jgi:hypothetical protein
MDRLHVERVAQDKGNALLGAEVGEPVPREDTFNSHDDILTMGHHDLEQGIWLGLDIAMHHNVTILVQDANVHAPGVQVDATIKLVRLGVESHKVSSSLGCLRC